MESEKATKATKPDLNAVLRSRYHAASDRERQELLQEEMEGIKRSLLETSRLPGGLLQSDDDFISYGDGLKPAFDAALIGLIVVDSETHEIINVNEAGGELLGYARDAVRGLVCHQSICGHAGGRCRAVGPGRALEGGDCRYTGMAGIAVRVIRNVTPFVMRGKQYILEGFVEKAQAKVVKRPTGVDLFKGGDGKEEKALPERLPHTSTLQAETRRRENAEAEAERSKQLLHLVFNLSTNFVYLPSEEIDSGISDMLGFVGQYAKVDRSFVFLLDETATKLTNTHEWRAKGVVSNTETQSESIDSLPWFREKMRSFEIINVPDVSKLPPEAAKERAFMERKGIRSLVHIPIVHGVMLFGFLGLDSDTLRDPWPDDIILLLRMMGEFFASAFMQRKTEEKLQESATRYRTLFEYANDSIFLIKEGQFVDCNSQTLRLFRCAREQIVGKGLHDFSPDFQPDGRKSTEKIIEKIEAALSGKPQLFEWRCRSGNKTLFDADVSLNKIDLGQGEILIQAIVRDVTIRKRWEQALRESEERYRSLFDDSRDAIYITRKDGTFVDVNRAFLDLFGYAKEEALRFSAKSAYVSRDDLARFKKMIEIKEYVKDFAITLKKRDESTMDCLVTVMTKRGENGIVVGYQGIIRDITATKRAEETIRHMAYHDALTGLPNRVLFNDRLVMAMANGLRSRKSVAVMMLDLDKFKQVNDALGHKIGDLLLRAVADRLKETLRKNDTVARMGGDEFLVILPEIADDSDAVRVAAKITEAFQRPFKLDARELSMTTSVGLALYPRDGNDSETIMKNADIAMYHAKGLGRNKCISYVPGMAEEIKKHI